MSYATAKAGESHSTWTFTNPRCENKATYYECNVTAVRKSDGSVTWNKATCEPGEAGAVSSGIADAHGFSVLCTARADLGGLYVSNFQNGPKVCSFGCEYDQGSKQSDTTITDKSNPSNSIRFGILLGGKANGNTCTNPDGSDKPKEKGEEPPACLAVGSDSAGTIYHCPKEDGGSCTISGRGTKFCQPPPPGTDGPKADTGRQDGNSQSSNNNSPPQPPVDRPGESWQPNGPGSTVCNNVTGACVQHNSYSNTGQPNPNGSPLPGDGSGANGTGQQESGSGDGSHPVAGTTGTDMGPTNAKLDAIKQDSGGILDKLGDLLDGLMGDGGEDIPGPGDGETEADKDVIHDGDLIDASQLDTSGFAGGSCAPIPGGGGGTLATAFSNSIALFVGWCDFIAMVRAFFITLASIVGVYILAGRNT